VLAAGKLSVVVQVEVLPGLGGHALDVRPQSVPGDVRLQARSAGSAPELPVPEHAEARVGDPPLRRELGLDSRRQELAGEVVEHPETPSGELVRPFRAALALRLASGTTEERAHVALEKPEHAVARGLKQLAAARQVDRNGVQAFVERVAQVVAHQILEQRRLAAPRPTVDEEGEDGSGHVGGANGFEYRELLRRKREIGLRIPLCVQPRIPIGDEVEGVGAGRVPEEGHLGGGRVGRLEDLLVLAQDGFDSLLVALPQGSGQVQPLQVVEAAKDDSDLSLRVPVDVPAPEIHALDVFEDLVEERKQILVIGSQHALDPRGALQDHEALGLLAGTREDEIEPGRLVLRGFRRGRGRGGLREFLLQPLLENLGVGILVQQPLPGRVVVLAVEPQLVVVVSSRKEPLEANDGVFADALLAGEKSKLSAKGLFHERRRQKAVHRPRVLLPQDLLAIALHAIRLPLLSNVLLALGRDVNEQRHLILRSGFEWF